MLSRYRLCIRAALALLLVAALGAPAAASEAFLTIERTASGPNRHPVAAIRAVTFDSDTLLVADTNGKQSAYPLNTITRIWFDLSGTATSAPIGPAAAAAMVKALHLFQSRPNPASLSTVIKFDVPAHGFVTLAIYDVRGARVRTLADARLESGEHTVTWDGRNDTGQRVAGGVYFYRLRAEGIDESRQMVYLR